MELSTKVIIGIFGSAFTLLFGGFDTLFRILLILMVMDYITGLIAAWYNHEINSGKGWRGVSKKVVMLVLVALAYQMDLLFGQEMLRGGVIWVLLINEGISIVENADHMGIQVPDIIKEKLNKSE